MNCTLLLLVTSYHNLISSNCLRKVFFFLLNSVLNPQQQRRLPLVQFTQLIELEQFIRKALLITFFDRSHQVRKQHILPRPRETVIQFFVMLESALRSHLISRRQVADAGLEEIIFHGPAHEVVVERRLGHGFEFRNRILIVALERREVRNFQVQLVRQGFGVVALVPLRGGIVGFQGLFLVADLHLVYLCEILLVCCGAPEIAFCGVVCDGGGEDARGIVR